MKVHWRGLLTALSLGAVVASTMPGCVVRARVRPAYVVDEAPPEPQYETVQPREGYVWVRGRWEWRANRWQWQRGHWVRARSGYAWEQGHWERRGNRWHWVEGRWAASATAERPRTRVRDHRGVDHRRPAPPAERFSDQKQQPRPNERVVATPSPQGPTTAPPAAKEAPPARTRRGFVWIEGHYEWRGNQQEWIAGHWEPKKAGKVWIPGHYEWRGNRYVWTAGRWEPERPRLRWQRGRWEMRGSVYVWVPGSWVQVR